MRPRRPFDFEAIAAAFAATGYERATMNLVAEHAQVARRTLYHHFGSKERLFDETVAALCEEVTAHLFAAYDEAAGLPLAESIRVANAAWVDYAVAHPEHYELLYRTSVASTPTAARLIDETLARIYERVAELFRTGLEAADRPSGQVADVLAAMSVGAAQMVGRELAERPAWDADAVLRLVTEMWSHALGNVSRHALADADKPARRRRR